MPRSYKTFRRDDAGNIALMFAILAPLLIGVAGGAIDYWKLAAAQGSLQEIADASAIAGAREYVLGQKRMDLPRKMAKQTADMQISQAGLSGKVTSDISTEIPNRSVTVEVEQVIKPSLLVGFFRREFTVSARATAVSYESANLCVLSLDPAKAERIALKDEAILTGNNCSVHANSTNTRALAAYDFSEIRAIQTSVTGGYVGPEVNFKPSPITDYPEKEDPLKYRYAPNVGSCDENDLALVDFKGELDPGVYCGGLEISGASDVEFRPGIYVIKNGDFKVLNKSAIRGVDVGFFLTGANTRFLFLDEADVSLSGPTNGPMAGLLFQQDRANGTEPNSEIKSPNVREMVGTIYLPGGDLYIDTNSEVAQESAYTAIISDELVLSSRSHLILNSDYAATDVPLPPGLEGPPVVGLRE